MLPTSLTWFPGLRIAYEASDGWLKLWVIRKH